MPTGRIGAKGELNPKATDDDNDAGVRELEKQLGLFRSFDHVHWVPINPSRRDANGNWTGGDREGRGDGRALTIAGKCMFAGHSNAGNNGTDTRPMEILRMADDPVRNPPVKVGEIPVPVPGTDDSIMASSLHKKADGTEVITVIRDISNDDGLLITYEVDPRNCAVTKTSETYPFGGDFHEFGMWIDPKNDKRILIVTSAYAGAQEDDPLRPGKKTPDMRVIAITDENTGAILPTPITLAQFTLQDVGGPVRVEQPDATGLYSDGRFPDYSHLKDNWGTVIAPMKQQTNYVHQATFSRDGERIYVAGGLAGFYILNSEKIAGGKDADLAAGRAGCNFESTNVFVNNVIGGDIDPRKLSQVANDCMHMVVNDDPGVKAMVAAGKVGPYLALLDRSRWDPYPPILGGTGLHSAIVIPDRPAPVKGNTKQRPNYIAVSEERGGCPTSALFFVDVSVEMTPLVVGTFGVPFNDVEECVKQPTVEPDGTTPRKRVAWQAHNPTVFKNLVFISWYGQGMRAIDISNIRNPREVGHANTLPHGQARSYVLLRDGLMYFMDNGSGIHVVRYTGPRANELPGPGTGTWEGNIANAHQ